LELQSYKKPGPVRSYFPEGGFHERPRWRHIKGSGRSYGECDLFDIVNQSKDLLLGFGGHKMAVGLALDINNFDAFKESLQKNYKAKNYNQNIEDKELIGELDFKTIDFDLINILEKYAPYGNSNTNPKFITKNVRVISCQKIGKDKNHLKLTLSQNSSEVMASASPKVITSIILNAIKFRDDSDIKPNSIIDIKYRVNKNIFRGKESLQLMIDEITTD
jgi:single-stranded-DNA-specific exonuclease